MLIYTIITLLLVSLAFFAGWRICARLQEKKRQRDWHLWLGIAGELTHQMGTPLSALMGWIDLLPNTKEPALALSEMDVSLERLRAIAVRLAHVGAPARFEKVSLGEMIERTRSYFLKRIARSSGIVVTAEVEGKPVAHANQELLLWALEGLVKNAVDAIDGPNGRIILRAFQHNDQAILEVEDNGCGISAEIQAQIFEPGFSTKMGGRGMGLPLARHIIESGHQGRLLISRTESGKGTLIHIELKGSSDA